MIQSIKPLSLDQLSQVVVNALEEVKGKDITVLDVAEIADYADRLIIASGTSNTHIRALANNVTVESKKAGNAPISAEGENSNEWGLIDLGDIVVHVMTPQARDFYDLERLWTPRPEESKNN